MGIFDADDEILAKARQVIEARLISEIEKKYRKKIGEYDDCCLTIAFEGTAQPKDGTSVDFDVIRQGVFFKGHPIDLTTDQLKTGWVVIIPKTSVFDNTKGKACYDWKVSLVTETFDIPLPYPKGTVLFDNFPHDNHTDKLVSDADSKVVFEVKCVVSVRRGSCNFGMIAPQPQIFAALASSESFAHSPRSQPVSAVIASLLEETAAPLLETLERRSTDIRRVRLQVEEALSDSEDGGFVEFVEGIGRAIKDKLDDIFGGVDVHIFPPSIDLGTGSHTVTVEPTAGGSVGPDGKASIGVQVDINPKGEGKGPVGRFTGSLDVDEKGKTTGGSINWQCRF